ncbi:hypothetical protein CVT25_005217 [Psilocybe cyanescens]|uniref:Uncharacterized protein n=1 Tax=Psilocybe cyanescens TaxID=93625 RepID=A0A409XMN3_PSICY|nr:hypothetical protein CVT25_005217 [Psilocybe cyanescens]
MIGNNLDDTQDDWITKQYCLSDDNIVKFENIVSDNLLVQYI